MVSIGICTLKTSLDENELHEREEILLLWQAINEVFFEELFTAHKTRTYQRLGYLFPNTDMFCSSLILGHSLLLHFWSRRHQNQDLIFFPDKMSGCSYLWLKKEKEREGGKTMVWLNNHHEFKQWSTSAFSIHQHNILFGCYRRQDPFTWTLLLEKMEESYYIIKIAKRRKIKVTTTSVLYTFCPLMAMDFKKRG